jgi:multidrug resistance efflux pump
MKTVGRFLLTLVLVIAACVGGYELWNYYMWSPWTRDAHVQADVVTIAPDVAGFVTDLRVKDNQFVHKGDVLMIIDQARYTRTLTQADANVAAQKANMDNVEQQWKRRQKLTELSISNEAKETAELTANQAAVAYQQALADRSTAQLNLDRTVVSASVNGFVTNLTLVVGQYAAVGIPVMALIDSDSYRITGFFEETKMPAIKPGVKAAIYLLNDTLPLSGHVESMARGITDRDDPNGPELLVNATPTFEWVRLAQRIPVRIHIDHVPPGVFVSSGMTCTVVVEAPPRPWAALATLRNWFPALREWRAAGS